MDEIKYRKALGENIRRIRKRQKMTQDVFSEKIGIEPSSLSNIENGKTLPSTLTILQIQQQFNISAQEIFDIEYLNNIKSIEEDIYSSVEKLDKGAKNSTKGTVSFVPKNYDVNRYQQTFQRRNELNQDRTSH